MATIDFLPVKKLSLDLKNFRTVPQLDEICAVQALIAVAPNWFWALMDSLLDDGYHPTENIVVLKQGSKISVREGNRRIAALKIIFGYVTIPNLEMPAAIDAKIKGLSKEWRKENAKVPCSIYAASESEAAQRVVTLTHAKGTQAGRNQWNAVARARYNRDNGGGEPALDLLEKYLEQGKNLTDAEAALWAGDYHLTVLAEALNNVAPRLGFGSARDLADKYPQLSKHRTGVEAMLKDIGTETLDFPTIRNKAYDFASTRYQIPIPPTPAVSPSPPGVTTLAVATGSGQSTGATSALGLKKTKAVAVNDVTAIKRKLRSFQPKGKDREKLVTLINESRTLKLDVQPHAFCFLLRSMFELSAKAYCTDHAASGGPKATKADGTDRFLVELLRDVTTHLTKNKTDKAMVKLLHGAMAELGKSEGFLSVTSMNQLIHNTKFIVDESHICSLFFNIFPLLEAMN